jgi:polyhydroxyalkanoate synthesis regulator phasin
MAKKENKKLVRKGLLVGVGIAAFAQEKAEKFVRELVKKEKINKTEGKKLVRTIYSEADKTRKKITSLVETELKKLLKTVKKPKKPVKRKKKKKKR